MPNGINCVPCTVSCLDKCLAIFVGQIKYIMERMLTMKNFKQVLSGVLAAAIILTQVSMPVAAFADEPDTAVPSSLSQVLEDEDAVEGKIPDGTEGDTETDNTLTENDEVSDDTETPPADEPTDNDDSIIDDDSVEETPDDTDETQEKNNTNTVDADTPDEVGDIDDTEVTISEDEEIDVISNKLISTLSLFSAADNLISTFASIPDNLGAMTVSIRADVNKRIEVTSNSASRTYGEDYVPAGFTVTAYGFADADKAAVEEAMSNFTYELIIRDSTGASVAQDSYTAAGQYDAYVSCNASYVNINGETVAIVSGDSGLAPGKITVNKRDISIQVTSDTSHKTYGDPDPVFAWEVMADTPLAHSEDKQAFTGNVSRQKSGTDYEAVGNYAMTLGDLSNPNYNITLNAATFVIEKATLTVTGVAVVNGEKKQNVTREYGDENPELSYTVTGLKKGDIFTDGEVQYNVSGTYQVDPNSGSVIVSTTATTSTAAGTQRAIEVTGLGELKNYEVNYVTGNITIAKRNVLVYMPSMSKDYGAADPAFVPTLSGAAMNGDGVWVNDGREATPAGCIALVGSITRVAGENVADYDYVNNYTNAKNPNYEIHFTAGQFSIGKIELTVSISQGNSKVYGNDNPDFSTMLVYSGWANGVEDLSELDFSGLDFDTIMVKTSDVGTYKVTPKGITSGNYALRYVAMDFEVTKRPATITLDAKEAVYGDKELALTWSSNQDAYIKANALSALRIALKREAGTDVGEYAITVSNDYVTQNPNYNITIANAPFYKITPRTVDVYVNDATKIYGNENPAFSIDTERLAADLVNNDQLSDVNAYGVSISCVADKTSPVNINAEFGINEPQKYPIVASGLSNGNYIFVYHDGYLTITPRDLSITIDSKTSIYGDPIKELTYTVNNAVNGDTVGNGINGHLYTANTIKNVGTYPILNDFNSPNYKIYCNSADYIVTPRDVTVFPVAESRYYGEENPEFRVDGSNFAPGESVDNLSGTPVFTCAATRTSDVGTYDVSVSGLSNDNYNITFMKGTLTVNARPVTITPDANQNKVYGDEDPELTFKILDTLTNTVFEHTNRDNIVKAGDLTGELSRKAGENAGEYDITIGSVSDSNYDITFVPGVKFTIEKADLYIRANNQSRLYGEENPEFTYRITGWKFDDTLDDLDGKLVMSCKDADGNDVDYKTAVGHYNIVPVGVSSDNYNILPYNGVLTISPRPLTITIEPKTKVYGESDPLLTYVLSENLVDPEGSPLVGGLNRDAGENVGAYEIHSTLANSNYDITVIPGFLTITPKPLTVTVADEERLYGDENPEFHVTYSEFAFDEDETVLDGELEFATDAVTVSPIGDYAVSASGLHNDNYDITFIDGTLTITPRPITVILEDKTQVYGEEEETLTWHLSEELVDENSPILVTITRDEGDVVGKYGIHAVCTNPNYDITVSEGVYEITARPITVIIDDHTSTYGHTVQELTYTLICELGEALVNDDVLDGAILTDPEEIKHVGEYPIISTLNNVNYEISYIPGKYTITVATIQTSFAEATKLYGTETKTPELLFKGWQYDDPEGLTLPEMEIVVASDIVGRKGYVADSATAAAVYGDAFSFAGVTDGDYLYSATTTALTVTRLPIHEGMYTISGSQKSDGVYNSDVTIKAAEGYKLSYSDALENNTWSDTLVISGDCKNKEVKFFAMRVEDGAITTSTTKTITIDTYVEPEPEPEPEPAPAPSNNPPTGIELFSNPAIGCMIVILAVAIVSVVVLLVKKKKDDKDDK